MKLTPPATLDRAQRREWRRVVDTLVQAGIDPAHRVALIGELVVINDRITKLRAEEEAARAGLPKRTAQRRLAEALTEKRRLHESVYRGSARRVYRPPEDRPPAITAKDARFDVLLPSDRDRAWWRAKAAMAGLPSTERDRAYTRTVAELGDEGWLTLLEPDEENAVAGAKAIRATYRGAGTFDDDDELG